MFADVESESEADADWGGLILVTLMVSAAASSMVLLMFAAIPEGASMGHWQSSAWVAGVAVPGWMLARQLAVDGRLKLLASALLLTLGNLWAIFFNVDVPTIFPALPAALALGIAAGEVAGAVNVLVPGRPLLRIVVAVLMGALLIAAGLVALAGSLMETASEAGIFFGLAVFGITLGLIQGVVLPFLPHAPSEIWGIWFEVPMRWKRWAFRRMTHEVVNTGRPRLVAAGMVHGAGESLQALAASAGPTLVFAAVLLLYFVTVRYRRQRATQKTQGSACCARRSAYCPCC